MWKAPAFSDLVIDRFLAGELPADEARAVTERLLGDAVFAARVDELRASRAAFSLSAPSFEAIAAVAATRAPWWQRLVQGARAKVAVGGLAAAAAAVVVVSVGNNVGNNVGAGGDVVRPKGAFLSFVVERDGVVTDGHHDSVVHPGDRVQFVVDAGAGAFVGVWSKDGAGVVSAYAPASGRLEHAQGKHSFANSTRLDDVTGAEVFVGVRCDHDVDAAVIARAVADRAANDDADGAVAGCALARVRVNKVRP